MKTIAILALAALAVTVAQTTQAQEVRKPGDAPPVRPETARANLTASKVSPAPIAPPPAPSPFAAPPSTYAPHHPRSSAHDASRFRPFDPHVLVPGYAAPYAADVAPSPDTPRDSLSDDRDGSAILRLDVEPRTAQIYVDGFYIGTVDDFEPEGVTLAAGRHRIDLREPGYETLTIPVDLASTFAGAAEPTRFRGALIPVRTPSPLPMPPRGSETMYVIPGCYAGNRPPLESALPRGCDIGRLHVLVLGT